MILSGAIGLRGAAAERARKACLYANPAHAAWVKHGKGKPPPDVLCAAQFVRGWELCPRHFPGSEALQLTDRRTMPSSTPRDMRWELRDYQRAALDAWHLVDDGVIVAPCGAGKTLIGCGALASRATPALILVHTRDLARQWIERIGEAMIGVECGEIRHGKDERDADVVVATLQSLTRWTWPELVAFGRGRGLVIVDECHHIPAETFSRVMLAMPARYRLGLTATPERADGLTMLLHWHLGEAVHAVERVELQEEGHVLLPEIRVIQTGWTSSQTEPAKRKRELAEDTDRNALLCDEVMRLAKQGRSVLVLVDLVEHAKALAAACTLQDVEARALVGALTPKQRREVLLDAERGAVRVIFATSLADEGLDLPRLDACVLATPCGNVARVEQRIGRVLRPMQDKPRPVVLDLVDAFGPARGYFRRRVRLYRERGWG
jgi:superfamily II DNA or RNA helicase